MALLGYGGAALGVGILRPDRVPAQMRACQTFQCPGGQLSALSLAMSSNVGDSLFPAPKAPQSGIKTVLQYTGIPPSWLDKRPRLPSRNWLIFLSVTSAITGYYIYDRQQCKKIRREYVDKVKVLATHPLGSMELPRKVTVYGAKWLGDEDYDRSMLYFRKYVKVRAHISLSTALEG